MTGDNIFPTGFNSFHALERNFSNIMTSPTPSHQTQLSYSSKRGISEYSDGEGKSAVAIIEEKRQRVKNYSRQRQEKQMAENLSVDNPVEPDHRPAQYTRYVPGLPGLANRIEREHRAEVQRAEAPKRKFRRTGFVDDMSLSEDSSRQDNRSLAGDTEDQGDRKADGDKILGRGVAEAGEQGFGDRASDGSEDESKDKDGRRNLDKQDDLPFDLPEIKINPGKHLEVTEVFAKMHELIGVSPQYANLVNGHLENGGSVPFIQVMDYIQERCEGTFFDDLIIVPRNTFQDQALQLKDYIHREFAKHYEEFYQAKADNKVLKVKDKIRLYKEKFDKLKAQNRSLRGTWGSSKQSASTMDVQDMHQDQTRTTRPLQRGRISDNPHQFNRSGNNQTSQSVSSSDNNDLTQASSFPSGKKSQWEYPEISAAAIEEFERRNPSCFDPKFPRRTKADLPTGNGEEDIMPFWSGNNDRGRKRQQGRPDALQPDESGLYGHVVDHDEVGPVYEYGTHTQEDSNVHGRRSSRSNRYKKPRISDQM